MWGLCALAALTVWKMSTPPSTLTLSISLIQVMNTPLRDMPSLKAKRKAFSTRKHNSTIRNTYYSATVYLIMPNTTLTDRNHMPACMYMLLQLQIAVSLNCIYIKLAFIHVCFSALLLESMAIGFTFGILYILYWWHHFSFFPFAISKVYEQ